MAEAAGRRPDETPRERDGTQDPESTTLGLVAGLLVLAIIAFVGFAGH